MYRGEIQKKASAPRITKSPENEPRWASFPAACSALRMFSLLRSKNRFDEQAFSKHKDTHMTKNIGSTSVLNTHLQVSQHTYETWVLSNVIK